MLQLDDATQFIVREKQAENTCICVCGVCVPQETQPNYFDFMPKVPKYDFYSEVLITFRIPTEQILLVQRRKSTYTLLILGC